MSKRYGRSKYNAHKTEIDGIVFDSKHEAMRYLELYDLLMKGEISELKLQKPYELTPQFREPDIIGPKGGRKKGKVILKASSYVADFVYRDSEGHIVVEDAKSPATRTPAYILKKKMMYMRYGILIHEV